MVAVFKPDAPQLDQSRPVSVFGKHMEGVDHQENIFRTDFHWTPADTDICKFKVRIVMVQLLYCLISWQQIEMSAFEFIPIYVRC